MSKLQNQPSTSELHERYEISQSTQLLVAKQRLLVCEAIEQVDQTFISVDGPCPLTINPEATMSEAQAKVDNARGLSGYIALDRECFYKPRTDPNAWNGVDGNHREEAYKVISELAARYGNVIAEIGSLEQLQRYGHLLVAMWSGGRNVRNNRLIRELALADRSIPFFVKNGLDGDIEPALGQIAAINKLRGGKGAPAVLIYRGGNNAQTPEASQEQYKRAHEATEGRLFYDTAHGVEMAYHCEGLFLKSAIGQMLASQALIHLTQQGYPPLGKLSEASDIPEEIDPHMPLAAGLSDSRKIHSIKTGQSASSTIRVGSATQVVLK